MKRSAVFFDRDNTLIVSDGYLGDPAGVVLVDGAADAVAKARQYGFKVVTISNQSGVARGLFDEAAVQAVNQRLSELLQQANPAAVIEDHEYCPYHPEAVVERYKQDSFLRKPKPGMILAAAEKLSLDLGRSWVVGDAARDIEAGKAAGCRTVLVQNPALCPSPAAEGQSDVPPDFTVSSVCEAIDLIARQSLCKPANKPADPPPDAPPAPAAQGSTNNEDPMTRETTESVAAVPLSSSPRTPAPPAGGTATKAVDPPPRAALSESPNAARLEKLIEQILVELRRREEPVPDFSVSKLMAGIVQILSLALLFLAYLRRDDPTGINSTLMFALFLQTLTIALLIMGKQR
ncbi:MAG: HAD family hydrolase [Planctomycetota bacterium]|nr:HAD family hydrolase [Planctomycetota bacterium]